MEVWSPPPREEARTFFAIKGVDHDILREWMSNWRKKGFETRLSSDHVKPSDVVGKEERLPTQL